MTLQNCQQSVCSVGYTSQDNTNRVEPGERTIAPESACNLGCARMYVRVQASVQDSKLCKCEPGKLTLTKTSADSPFKVT